ncbi:MAG: LytR C-terminal domain-containing protein [Gemmatimonadota bacterium]
MRSRLTQLGILVALLAVGTLLGSALAQFLQPEPTPAPEAVAPLQERVRVEVLNGGGRSGVARTATEALRSAGYDVVSYQNAETFSEEPSVVTDRVGRPEWARRVAEVLRIDSVVSVPDSSRLLEVTVRLGIDWVPDAVAPADTGSRPWWDPRGYIRR